MFNSHQSKMCASKAAAVAPSVETWLGNRRVASPAGTTGRSVDWWLERCQFTSWGAAAELPLSKGLNPNQPLQWSCSVAGSKRLVVLGQLPGVSFFLYSYQNKILYNESIHEQ